MANLPLCDLFQITRSEIALRKSFLGMDEAGDDMALIRETVDEDVDTGLRVTASAWLSTAAPVHDGVAYGFCMGPNAERAVPSEQRKFPRKTCQLQE